MSLIEKAAQRLETLRGIGAAAPDPVAVHAESGEPAGAPPGGRRVEIDTKRLAAEGFVTPDDPGSRVAEEFRIVKRPLVANALARNPDEARHPNLVMVTSAVPGEGKTFCALNLAMSLAMEVDRSVLLVDADVVRPTLEGMLGAADRPGLLDVVGGAGMDVREAIAATSVERLHFLGSGRRHPRAAELLASEAMARLLRRLATERPDRIVVFDSPPLLVTTEARELAAHMGQMVFVVRAEETLRADVQRALALIEACPVRLMLLNMARAGERGAYGYGYGYGR